MHYKGAAFKTRRLHLSPKMRLLSYIALLPLLLILAGCEVFGPDYETDEVKVDVPATFSPLPIPEYNPLTPAKVELGKQLFFDPILSGDQTISCGSCHEPNLYFADGKRLSHGVQGREGLRNSPSLLNIAYQRLFFWDGGSLTLEAQVMAPLENELEMDADIGEVLDRLIKHPEYPKLFNDAFNEGPSVQTLTQAIAAYERTLVSTPSRYDQFQLGNEGALTAQEQEGLALFNGKAGCVNCHAGPLLTNFAFENKGLTLTPADSGRARITGFTADYGKFKVPSLRNVAQTAPYMHDGRFTTLAEVIAHYNNGGDNIRNQSPEVKPRFLVASEIDALVAFLHSLTDE